MSRTDELRRVVEGWGGRPTVAVIDLDQLRSNVHELRTLIGPDVRLMSVVKAEGYGHGAIPVAKSALAAGADELAVAVVEEGVRLRDAGIEAPVLVMGPVGNDERQRAISRGLTLVVSDPAFARGLAGGAKLAGRKEPVGVHLKIDSGMRRFGIDEAHAVELAKTVDGLEELRLDGVMTHFAAADDPDASFTMQQAAVFDRACDAIRDAGIEIPGVHLANSAATLKYPELRRDRVRAGVAMYGLRPDPQMALPSSLRPVMTVHSRLARIVPLEPGDTVSYGRTWMATGAGTAGLVPIGYADGYVRQGSNVAWMDVRGRKAPVRGRVCMDQTVVQVDADARPGDAVTVIGDGHTSAAPSLDELAEIYGTISYALTTGFVAGRVPHLYMREGRVVAIADLAGYRELAPAALT